MPLEREAEWKCRLVIREGEMVKLNTRCSKKRKKLRNSKRQFPKVKDPKIKKINQALIWLKMSINELNDK